MRNFLVIILFSSLMVVTAMGYNHQRHKRFLSVLDWLSSGGRCSGCPRRHCLDDRAVINGYCCGCARVSDFLPINCPAIPRDCPSDGRRLCKDYDYMLDCCCPSP